MRTRSNQARFTRFVGKSARTQLIASNRHYHPNAPRLGPPTSRAVLREPRHCCPSVCKTQL